MVPSTNLVFVSATGSLAADHPAIGDMDAMHLGELQYHVECPLAILCRQLEIATLVHRVGPASQGSTSPHGDPFPP